MEQWKDHVLITDKRMRTFQWFSLLSGRQRIILLITTFIALSVAALGFLGHDESQQGDALGFSTDMPISRIAPGLGVTGKALARELMLPIDVSKSRPLKELKVSDKELSHAVDHLLSHKDSPGKYYLFVALVLVGAVYLNMLGRPDASGVKQRKSWYPRSPYIVVLLVSVLFAGFYLGKSPNPMEGVVKVFKSMVGLYPDSMVKAAALLFFIALAVVGNKVVCGWACPFGAFQELIYSIPVLRRAKKHKLPFALTNTIRAALFLSALLILFGIVGGRTGLVLYHFINPFDLFDLDLGTTSIRATVVAASVGSFFTYRPFCQIICPFGLVSWVCERFSITRVQIDKDRCVQCGACIKACPSDAAKGRVYGASIPADCFSCARCLNVCPEDAITYGPVRVHPANRAQKPARSSQKEGK